MLIKRQPHLSWFIHFLAIILMCLLIANSILGSIYINNLKNRMNDITDNYLISELQLQSALESLIQTRISLLKYNLALKEIQNTDDFIKVKTNIFMEYQKNAINLSSLLLNLKKKETNDYVGKPIEDLYLLTTQYLLSFENFLSSKPPTDLSSFIKEVESSRITYLKIKQQLEVLSEILRQKAEDVKNSDTLIAQYFPSILLASFFIALIIGGAFIYVSRREVRKSILEQTSQILTEAYQYQKDCLQTLEICKEISTSELQDLKKITFSLADKRNSNEVSEIIEKFHYFINRIIDAFETRKNLHHNEINNLENSFQHIKSIEKNT